MGYLLYGTPPAEIEIDDRVLAHVQIVVIAKLRRGESFAMSWDGDKSGGSGRETLWMHPSIPIHFKFFGSRNPELSREWIDALMNSANSAEGMRLTAEPHLPNP